jgi:hypothetical protein
VRPNPKVDQPKAPQPEVRPPEPAKPQEPAKPSRLGSWWGRADVVPGGAKVYKYGAGKKQAGKRRQYVRYEWKDGEKRRVKYIAPLKPVWSKRRMTDGEAQQLKGKRRDG